MTSESGPLSGARPWTLLLSPGESLRGCLPLLQALAARREECPPVQVEQLEDWSALICDLPNEGRILVDAESLGLEEVGLLRALLRSRSGWELWLFGNDSSRAAVRQLLGESGTFWVPAPLELETAAEFVTAPADQDRVQVEEPVAATPRLEPEENHRALESQPAPDESAPPEPEQTAEPVSDSLPPSSEQAELLEEIERILSGAETQPVDSHSATPTSTQVLPPTTRPAIARISEPVALPADSQGPQLPTPPAPYFKNQIADLADIVQCVDLSLEAAVMEVASADGEAAAHLARRFEDLGGEVARLRQFTRTLSFLAAPPMAGNQLFDLGPMLEEMLSSLRGEQDAPRYLLRISEPLTARSDKRLLSQAFDALLFFTHRCSGPEGTARIDGRRVEDPLAEPGEADRVLISIRFPAGAFGDREPAQVLEPYALRQSLPELGANALAAAAGILRGQGGGLDLHQERGGGLEWLIHLPFVE